MYNQADVVCLFLCSFVSLLRVGDGGGGGGARGGVGGESVRKDDYIFTNAAATFQ